jgi:hypothetical protein
MDKESAYIKEIISSIQPLPPRKQVIGKTTVAWWEGKPGDAIVMAEGGSPKDETLVEQIVANQLRQFGYKRANFHFAEGPDPLDTLDREREGVDNNNLDKEKHDQVVKRQENWNNLVEKAKRLIDTGNVTVVTNEPDYVYGNVIGDHGSYQCTIKRNNPEEPRIVGWKCTCPWNQYAYMRTRKWKIYEGRPCSHILALYYLSKISPITGEEPSEPQGPEPGPPPAPTIPTSPAPVGEPSPFATPPGMPGGEPGGPGMPGGGVPAVPEGPRGIQQLTPFKPEDVGANDPNELLEQRLGPLAPQRPEVPEEESMPRRNIQMPPLEQLKEMQRLQQPPSAPGQAPYGQIAPPGTVSVPGARLPNERNPMGLPGGVYSKTNVIGLDDNDNYREVKAGTEAEVLAIDETTRMAEVLFKSANVRCYVNSDDLEIN